MPDRRFLPPARLLGYSAATFGGPAGRALGVRPTTTTGNALIDAYLWIKRPGESDGACGDLPSPPPAGAFFPAYAQMLAKAARF